MCSRIHVVEYHTPRLVWEQSTGKNEENNSYEYNGEEPSDFLVLEKHIPSTYTHVVVKTEIHTTHQHEEGRHIFQIPAVEVSYTGSMGAETACRNGCHRMADSIVDIHWADPIKEATGKSENQINDKQPSCRAAYLWAKFVQPYSCHFSGEDIRVLHLIDRYERNREDHYTQTSHPLGDTSPKLQRMSHAVYV